MIFKAPRHMLYLNIFALIKSFLKLLLFSSKKGFYYNKLKEKFIENYKIENIYFLSTWRIGLFFILKSYKFDQGSEILITSIGIPDKINSINLAGLKPVYVEMDIENHNYNINQIEKKITDKTKAIHITYLSGIIPELDAIIEIAKKYDLKIIEDISQAYGANYKNKKIGTIGDASIGSFSLGKTVSANGGGVVIIKNKSLIAPFEKLFNDNLKKPSKIFLIKLNINQIIISLLTSKFIYSFITYYIFKIIKFLSPETFSDPELKNKFFKRMVNEKNYYKNTPVLRDSFPDEMFTYMVDSEAQLCLSSLNNLERNINIIRKQAKLYTSSLNEKFISTLPNCSLNVEQNVYWHFPININKNYDLFRDYLFKNGIDCVSYGLPLNNELEEFKIFKEPLIKSNRIKNKSLFLPIHPNYNLRFIKKIIETVNNFQYEV